MSENHLETCLYHLVGIIEPVFKRVSATYDTCWMVVLKVTIKISIFKLTLIIF
jgi:hypothetical protein